MTDRIKTCRRRTMPMCFLRLLTAVSAAVLVSPICRGSIVATPSGPALPKADLDIGFSITAGGSLLQEHFLPAARKLEWQPEKPDANLGTEVTLQITGRNWITHLVDKRMGGYPGQELHYEGQSTEATPGGQHVVLKLKSTDPKLDIESHYQFFTGIPVVRRWTRVINRDTAPVGLEYVSSALLYRIANYGNEEFEKSLRVHYANSSWQCEAQWHSAAPSQLGFTDQGTFNLNTIAFSNEGSWSTMNYLPMAMVENKAVGVTWFWQIEHSGSWHWELGNVANRATYVYLGGPDELSGQAWKNLRPGASYDTVPVAVGCVSGGFEEGVAALTAYRRRACLQPHPDNERCSLIFNDYMNCLWADPTTEKELPLIDAAARVGCEYFVIDAGWYAELDKTWWDSVGLWQPSHTRWGPDGAKGLKVVLDQIRARGMVPGLWLEIEVAGINSPLKDRPDSWFFRRHGMRVIKNGRYFLDFRNPDVRAFADEIANRLVRDYQVGYIKMDYNVDALMGTETDADSFGQGLLEHQRAYLGWIDELHRRYPQLVIENCGSGGGRMDYAMLSRHQLQSSSDQTDYRRYPSIVVGGLAAVLPEQLAVWSYPQKGSDADEASFNMVTAMLGRIHQSGNLASLGPASRQQVENGLRLYKERVRPHLPRAIPFFPLGLPAMADTISPIAVGLHDQESVFMAVWRLKGDARVSLPMRFGSHAHVLYPTDLGISLEASPTQITVTFPRAYMGALVEILP